MHSANTLQPCSMNFGKTNKHYEEIKDIALLSCISHPTFLSKTIKYFIGAQSEFISQGAAAAAFATVI
jgi:hypothetical protein